MQPRRQHKVRGGFHGWWGTAPELWRSSRTSPAATVTGHCTSPAATVTGHCTSPAATVTGHCTSPAATVTGHHQPLQ
jgi:metal-dependent hydrolase (beta-lactamase superfamily II)